MTGTSRRWPGILPDDANRERSGLLPGPFLLRSAARVLTIVGRSRHTAADVWASYRATASGGLLSSDGLLSAQRWLVDQGWLDSNETNLIASNRCQALPDDEDEVARELLRAIIFDSPPTWLSAVTARGEIRPELLPEQVEQVLGVMFDAEERDAILYAAAVKYDEAALRATGDAGEEAVLTACRAFLEDQRRPELARRVRRVSLISDALGYDIAAPDLAGRECRLEVKSYRGRYPNFYITRNEFEVGLRLSRWYLVLCRSVTDSIPSIMGWTTLAPLCARMPVDQVGSATWQVVRVRIDESHLRPGLPISRMD